MAYSETNNRFSPPLITKPAVPLYRPPSLCVPSTKEGEYLPRSTSSGAFQFPSPIHTVPPRITQTVPPRNGMSSGPSAHCSYRTPTLSSVTALNNSAGESKICNGILGRCSQSSPYDPMLRTCSPVDLSAETSQWQNPLNTSSHTPRTSPPDQEISQTANMTNCLMPPTATSPVLPGTSFCNRTNKRKMDVSDSDDVSRKVFVNEERMSARMQQLHLDNNNLSWHPDLESVASWLGSAPPSASGTTRERSDSEDGEEECIATDMSTKVDVAELTSKDSILHLAPEIRQLNRHTKHLLPSSIVDEINKSALQVVLWKPPGEFIKDILPRFNQADQAESASSQPAEDLSAISLDVMDISTPERPIHIPASSYLSETSSSIENSLQMGLDHTSFVFPPLPDDDDMDL